jgi:hypothetical protein
MVYTKRPRKSYGGRNCGHRKDICENHWYRLRVFENRVLRRIFGPKRDEVTGE